MKNYFYKANPVEPMAGSGSRESICYDCKQAIRDDFGDGPLGCLKKLGAWPVKISCIGYEPYSPTVADQITQSIEKTEKYDFIAFLRKAAEAAILEGCKKKKLPANDVFDALRYAADALQIKWMLETGGGKEDGQA